MLGLNNSTCILFFFACSIQWYTCICEGQDEVVAVLATKLTKSLIRYIPLPPIYTLGLILSPKPPRVHPDLHVYHMCTCIEKPL